MTKKNLQCYLGVVDLRYAYVMTYLTIEYLKDTELDFLSV